MFGNIVFLKGLVKLMEMGNCERFDVVLKLELKLKIGTRTPVVNQTGVPFRSLLRQSTVRWCSKTFSLLIKFNPNSVRTSP